jgi:hypothetical protein
MSRVSFVRRESTLLPVRLMYVVCTSRKQENVHTGYALVIQGMHSLHSDDTSVFCDGDKHAVGVCADGGVFPDSGARTVKRRVVRRRPHEVDGVYREQCTVPVVHTRGGTGSRDVTLATVQGVSDTNLRAAPAMVAVAHAGTQQPCIDLPGPRAVRARSNCDTLVGRVCTDDDPVPGGHCGGCGTDVSSR